MALQKQVLSVNLSQGVDTKSDPKGVVAGKLLTLENGIFSSPKRIRKRNGYQALSRAINIPQSSTLTAGQALLTYQNELILCDKSSLNSWDASGSAWFSKGSFVSCNVTQSPVVRNTFQQTQQDSTTHPSGLQAVAWEDSSGGSRYSVVDSTTGQVLVANALILATAIKPKLLNVGNLILLFYVNTADSKLYLAPISVAAPATALAPVAMTAASGNNSLNATLPNYDATVINTVSGPVPYLAFNNGQTVAQGTTIFSLSAAVPTTVLATVTIASEVSTVLTIFGDLLNRAPVLAYWNGTAVKFRAYDSTLATLLGSGTVETLASVVSLTGVSISSSALNLRIYYSVSAASTFNYLTRVNGVTGAFAVSTPAVFLRSVALFGKAFLYGGTAYLPLVFQSPLQPTYFIQGDGASNVAAKILYSVAGPIPTRASLGSAMLTEANALSDGTSFQLALLEKTLLTTQSGQVYTLTGVTSATANFFDTQNSYLHAQLGHNLHIGGGCLTMYDGISPVEHGFHLYPEPVTVPNPGGAFTYQYVVTYEWMDNLGQVHRSAPSVPVTQTQANAIDGGHTVTVTIPTLRVTAKQAPRSPVLCVVYRTINLGTTFFQATSISSPTQNSTTADTVTFVDSTTDANLIGNPVLYTTGNVIENLAPNAVGSMCVHHNRIFALDSTNPLQIVYSKQVVPTAPVEFSAGQFVLNVDPRGGDCTTVASLDDKLIVFKTGSIFYHLGQGPDATGGQNDFSDSIFITSDVGCVNPRSVVFVSLEGGNAGLMFQTAKGIYLLDRALRVSYIGAEVEAYNGFTVTSAQQLSNTHQIRFTLSNGTALVYDDMFQQWSVFTNHSAVDSAIWQGQFSFLSANGTVFQETPGIFNDAGNFIKLRLVTSWLQFAGVQGFQRIYKALILGEYASPHQLLVQVAYDFNPSFVQQDVISPNSPGNYGSDATYGSGSPYGGAFPLYQWRLFPTQQQCEAIQLSIEDVSTGTMGEAMSLSGLTFEVGTKRGAFKLPPSNSSAL